MLKVLLSFLFFVACAAASSVLQPMAVAGSRHEIYFLGSVIFGLAALAVMLFFLADGEG